MKRPPQKRQIIKTRSQGPYIIARIVIVLLVLIVLTAIAITYERHHAGGAFFGPEIALVSRQ
jgi:cell division protein FtsL